MKNLLLLIVSIITIIGCNVNEKKNTFENIDTLYNNQSLNDSSSFIICSMPAPLQIANLIKNENTEFYDNFLEPASHKDFTALSITNKALLLGILSIDLGYSIVYDKQQNILNFVSKVKILSEDLGVIGAFSPAVVKRLENNIKNPDSLSFIALSSFNEVTNYFNENERQETAVLMLTGGLIEGIYLSSNIAKLNPSNVNKNIVAQQKFFIDNALKLFDINNETLPEIKDLKNSLDELQKEFDKIEITYLESDKNKNKVVEKITLTDKQLDNITQKINELHNSIIQ
ncbi:MAG: hypothetical protein A2046_05610 [Bacteroidetes bacterium GWA2_30_7]|nr:MAG: hypothetical protein A2046_05610 [Bacteroidetes bacterium GWA2_30_7]